jgi:hypothetical protein
MHTNSNLRVRFCARRGEVNAIAPHKSNCLASRIAAIASARTASGGHQRGFPNHTQMVAGRADPAAGDHLLLLSDPAGCKDGWPARHAGPAHRRPRQPGRLRSACDRWAVRDAHAPASGNPASRIDGFRHAGHNPNAHCHKPVIGRQCPHLPTRRMSARLVT